MPIILTLSKEYFLDVGATAFVAASILYIIKTKSFEKRKESIIAGLVIGISLLIKWTNAIFILGFLLGYVFNVQIKKSTTIKIKNTLLCGLSACIISIPWYVVKFKELLFILSKTMAVD